MKRRDFLQSALVLGSGGASALVQSAQAQTEARALRLVFSRGGELFVSPSMDGTDARRVLTVGEGALWAVSPDGRRVVWIPQSNLAKSNPTVFLSDLIGRHQKKLLTLGDLRDRQGNAVKKAGVNGAEDLTNWQPVSLGWSADGRTVYVGSSYNRATFAVDGLSGAAVVNGAGQWKPIALASNIDAQGSLLVGVGDDLPKPEFSDASTTDSGTLVVINLAEGGIRTFFGSRKASDSGAPINPYDFVEYPAISPDHRTIAFVSGIDSGLWLRDRWAASPPSPVKIAPSATGKPQWVDDGKAIYFMSRSGTGSSGKDVLDLYQMDIPTPNTAGMPRLVLKNVDAFTLAPL